MRAQSALGVAVVLASAGLAVAAYTLLAGHAIEVAPGATRYVLRAPELLAAAATLPLVTWGAWRSLVDLPTGQRALALFVRALVCLLLVLALARPSEPRPSERVSAVMLVDVSESISDADLDAARTLAKRAFAARGENELHLVTFAGAPHAVAPKSEEEIAAAIARRPSPPGAAPHTDLQAALQLAYGLFSPGHLRRVALVSDGLETRGSILEEAARAAAMGVRIHPHVLRAGAPDEVAVRQVALPERIRVGEPFELRATLSSTRRARARVKLYQGELLNGLDSLRDVELEPGETELAFSSIVRTAGAVEYRLELTPEGPDRFATNNIYPVTAVVPGRPRVLLVDADPAQAAALARALDSAEFEVDLRSALAFPGTLDELAHHDFVILSDVAAERLSLDQMGLLERYLRDVGGGFLMAGGENGFGLGGWEGTRVEEILPVRMQSERRRDEHSLALALVIDCSGSMVGPKIELAKDAAKATAEILGADDSIAVVGFASRPDQVVRLQSARNRLRILQSIGRLVAQGGTAIFPALDLAYQDLAAARARVKHVILLTDGQTREDGIPALVQTMRAEGITVSAVGLGTDVNRKLLETVASEGRGRAYFTDDPYNVPRIFVRETTTVGRNSAVEELFQPRVATRADFLRGIDGDRFPLLRGYVATQAKPAPAQVVLESDLGEPILARWRVGLGWALAWTSDVKSRWASDWIRWPGFAAFWGQLVREHMRQDRQHELTMHAEVREDVAHVWVDALGPDDRFLNGLDSQLSVQGPGGRGGTDAPAERRVALRQRAPGRYQTSFPLDGYGSFVLAARHTHDGSVVARSDAQLSHPYPREHAARTPDAALLERVAVLTGGAALVQVGRLFEPAGDRIEAYEERWPWLVLCALALFLVDLLLRRVRLFDRGFRRAGGGLPGVTGLGRPPSFRT